MSDITENSRPAPRTAQPARSDTQPGGKTLPSDTAPKQGDAAGGDPAGDDAKGDDATGDGKGGKNRWPLIILAIVVLVAAAVAVWWWLATRNLESTDDAYTDGDAVIVAPKVAGYVTQLSVSDNTLVKAGQLLFQIDPRTYIAARDQARASLAMAQSQLTAAEVNLDVTRVRAPATLAQAQAQLDQARATQDQAEQNYRRQHAVDPRATTQTNVDQASATLKSETAAVKSAQANVQIASLVQQSIQTAEQQVRQAQAQVAKAQANLETAEVNLSYTEIRAPQDGRITERNINLGNYAQAGQQSFYIVTPHVWVIANFKENQLADIEPGQHVTITVDAYPKLTLHGHVDSIQQGSGAQFSAFPAENATGNYVKIVRRVPVKIVIDDGLPEGQGLPLGLSVNPTVTVR